ncbi:MAG: phospholipase D-like domain-containing protein [Candidatus Babeliales bacterium]
MKTFQVIGRAYLVLIFLAFAPLEAKTRAVPKTKTDTSIEQLLSSTDDFHQAFIIPVDAPKALLMALIHNERNQILAALYNFTEPDVASAIIAAFKRGVDVQVITDVEGLRGKYERISVLYEYGIPVHLYAHYRSLMHNKYFVFADTLGTNSVVWSGSANITKVGLTGNEENVIVTNNSDFVETYQQAWHGTKERIQQAKKSNVQLRPYCKYVGNNLLVEFGKVFRRFKCFR